MRLLLVGHGRMGRLVEQLAPQYGFEVAAVLEVDDNEGGAGVTEERCRGIDVAVDFSAPESSLATAPRLAAQHVNLVVGSTGWQAREAEVRAAGLRAERVEEAGPVERAARGEAAVGAGSGAPSAAASAWASGLGAPSRPTRR